jgi:hypothetical protein
MAVYVDDDSFCHIEFARPHNSIRKGTKYMKKSLIASLLIFGAVSASAAGAPNLTGNWAVHNSIAGNESDQECKFVQSDNKLTGTCKGAEKDVKITGSTDGKKVTWKYESEYNGTPLTLTYTATLDDSGKIAGSVDVDPFGVTGEFTATPSKKVDK